MKVCLDIRQRLAQDLIRESLQSALKLGRGHGKLPVSIAQCLRAIRVRPPEALKQGLCLAHLGHRSFILLPRLLQTFLRVATLYNHYANTLCLSTVPARGQPANRSFALHRAGATGQELVFVRSESPYDFHGLRCMARNFKNVSQSPGRVPCPPTCS